MKTSGLFTSLLWLAAIISLCVGVYVTICGMQQLPSYEQRAYSKLLAISIALQCYKQDYDGVMPITHNADDIYSALEGYLKNKDAGIMPSSHDRYLFNVYVSGKSNQAFDLSDFVVAVYESKPYINDSIGFVTVNGDIGRADQSLWLKLKAVSHITNK